MRGKKSTVSHHLILPQIIKKQKNTFFTQDEAKSDNFPRHFGNVINFFFVTDV